MNVCFYKELPYPSTNAKNAAPTVCVGCSELGRGKVAIGPCGHCHDSPGSDTTDNRVILKNDLMVVAAGELAEMGGLDDLDAFGMMGLFFCLAFVRSHNAERASLCLSCYMVMNGPLPSERRSTHFEPAEGFAGSPGQATCAAEWFDLLQRI